MLENIECIHVLFWFGIPLPGYCMGRCTVKQGRTLRENPTVSSGDPSCSDSWMAAAETKSSSLWKWCLRTSSILSQVSVIKVYMYDMCTTYVHVCYVIFSIHEKTILHFFRVESIFTKMSFKEFDEFSKDFTT